MRRSKLNLEGFHCVRLASLLRPARLTTLAAIMIFLAVWLPRVPWRSNRPNDIRIGGGRGRRTGHGSTE